MVHMNTLILIVVAALTSASELAELLVPNVLQRSAAVGGGWSLALTSCPKDTTVACNYNGCCPSSLECGANGNVLSTFCCPKGSSSHLLYHWIQLSEYRHELSQLYPRDTILRRWFMVSLELDGQHQGFRDSRLFLLSFWAKGTSRQELRCIWHDRRCIIVRSTGKFSAALERFWILMTGTQLSSGTGVAGAASTSSSIAATTSSVITTTTTTSAAATSSRVPSTSPTSTSGGNLLQLGKLAFGLGMLQVAAAILNWLSVWLREKWCQGSQVHLTGSKGVWFLKYGILDVVVYHLSYVLLMNMVSPGHHKMLLRKPVILRTLTIADLHAMLFSLTATEPMSQAWNLVNCEMFHCCFAIIMHLCLNQILPVGFPTESPQLVTRQMTCCRWYLIANRPLHIRSER